MVAARQWAVPLTLQNKVWSSGYPMTVFLTPTNNYSCPPAGYYEEGGTKSATKTKFVIGL